MIKLIVRKVLRSQKLINNNITTQKPHGGFVNEKELQILKLVFKWKVLSFSIIKMCLLKNENEHTFKQRVNRLVQKGYLQRIDYIGKLILYQLTEFGFLRMKNGIDGFKEEGFASEALWHDFVSVAFQLGVFASVNSKNVEIVTEQQLRRFQRKELPFWVPQVESHRPDGFTRFKSNNSIRIAAYEIETSVKTMDRYDSICQYYAKSADVDLIFWIVKNKTHYQAILKSILRIDASIATKHVFILMSDFASYFWEAKTFCGQEPGLPYVSMMSSKCILDISEMYQACIETSVPDFLKDLAKG